MNREPNTLVRDVLNDLYDFRNIVAHGQEIPAEPYRTKKDLISTEGKRVNCEDYYGAVLMLESSLFILTTALRRIFTENLFDDVADAEKWWNKMACQ